MSAVPGGDRRPRPGPPAAAVPVLATTLATALAVLTACAAEITPVGGDPEEGRVALREYGCVACHQVPGVPGPQGRVGPPLATVVERRVVAGVLPNSPDNLRAWIQHPQEIEPGSLMPDLGVTDEDGDDIVAYLMSLEEP